MKRSRASRRIGPGLLALGAALVLVGCGPTADIGAISRPQLRAFRSVSGVIDAADGGSSGPVVTLDGPLQQVALDPLGRFCLSGVSAGDHSLFVATPSGQAVEVPFRAFPAKDLDLGTITIRGDRLEGVSGFSGYGFGYADENDDSRNDLFADEDGDGICDVTGEAYDPVSGWVDHNGRLR